MAEGSRVLKIISIIEVVLLVAAFVAGMVVVISLRISQNNNEGYCLFYAEVQKAGPQKFAITSSKVSTCSYCTWIQAIALIIAFLYGAYRIVNLCTNRFKSSLLRVISVPIHGLVSFLILVQACIVTVGLKRFCSNIHDIGYSCSSSTVEGVEFYSIIEVAQGASWFSFLTWCVLTLLAVCYICIERREKTKGNQPRKLNSPVADDGYDVKA
ncbi:transmembrane protein 179B-like isoform X2 [Amphiura filiformis]|uniref:transmembrane protein 179B-like isoform X2 n=1 Tax=Amphiura filiformis TaxID=82378 RepID=UPI003B21F18B